MNNDALNIILKNINEVQTLFDNYQRECFPQRTREFFCLELCGEAGELANAEKKRWKGKPVSSDIFLDEAADVLIALMNYSNAAGLNLGEAVSVKLAKIEAKRAELVANGEKY